MWCTGMASAGLCSRPELWSALQMQVLKRKLGQLVISLRSWMWWWQVRWHVKLVLKTIVWVKYLWNLARGGLLLNLFAPCYLSSMVANKVIIFVAKSMANTAVHSVTNIHVIACMKIWMILNLSAHSYWLRQSTKWLNMVHKRSFASFQFKHVTIPSIVFRWGRTTSVASSCVQMLMWCIQLKTASSCMYPGTTLTHFELRIPEFR
jgi:hypothetical protein